MGQAGTGKGVVLSAATDAWQKEGYEVIGTAVPGATAMRLQADTKSDQGVTADSLITSFEHGHLKLDPNTVIVLDEAGMLDSERLSKLVRLADDTGVKLVLTGDAAQLYSLGAGGLFKELEGKVPTAELTEVHRAHHQWEREAWSEVREGEPGLALARYRAHDRLHVYDTRAEATQAMVENWDQNRQGLPPDQTVMITDSSNEERDEMNALAQDRRAQAGELGIRPRRAARQALRPRGRRRGDLHRQIQDQTPQTRRERDHRDRHPRQPQRGQGHDPDPREPSHGRSRSTPRSSRSISLAYAVHIRKGQGLTSETSGILAGGWQTDKEHMYVSLSRARERTDVYVSREDLGEQGMDTGAIERLGERMARSRAQEASITKDVAEPTAEPERTAAARTDSRATRADRARPHKPRPSRAGEQPERSATSRRPSHTSLARADRRPPRARALSRAITATRAPGPDRRAPAPASSRDPRRRPRNTSQGTESEIDEVLKDRRARQFDWQRADRR